MSMSNQDDPDPRPSGYDPEEGVPRYLAKKNSAGDDQAFTVGLLAGVAALFVAYFAAEALLVSRPHEWHWGGAFGTGAVVMALVWITARLLRR